MGLHLDGCLAQGNAEGNRAALVISVMNPSVMFPFGDLGPQIIALVPNCQEIHQPAAVFKAGKERSESSCRVMATNKAGCHAQQQLNVWLQMVQFCC